MTNKTRTTIAALATALFLAAMSTAGALTHSHATPVTATNHGVPAAVTAPRAIQLPDPESMTND